MRTMRKNSERLVLKNAADRALKWVFASAHVCVGRCVTWGAILGGEN